MHGLDLTQEEAKAKCHSVRQLAEQLMWVGVQNCNRDATVSSHRAAFVLHTDLLLEAAERVKRQAKIS